MKGKVISKMEIFYWVDGLEFVSLLKKHGYCWKSGNELIGSGKCIYEKIMEEGYSYVPVIDHENKTVGLYPLEIYAPNSPTRDDEKFKKIADRCMTKESLIYILSA